MFNLLLKSLTVSLFFALPVQAQAAKIPTQSNAVTQIEQLLNQRGQLLKIEIQALLQFKTETAMQLQIKALKVIQAQTQSQGLEIKILDRENHPTLVAYVDQSEWSDCAKAFKALQASAEQAQGPVYFEHKYVSRDGLELGYYYLPLSQKIHWFLQKKEMATALTLDEWKQIHTVFEKSQDQVETM